MSDFRPLKELSFKIVERALKLANQTRQLRERVAAEFMVNDYFKLIDLKLHKDHPDLMQTNQLDVRRSSART